MILKVENVSLGMHSLLKWCLNLKHFYSLSHNFCQEQTVLDFVDKAFFINKVFILDDMHKASQLCSSCR